MLMNSGMSSRRTSPGPEIGITFMHLAAIGHLSALPWYTALRESPAQSCSTALCHEHAESLQKLRPNMHILSIVTLLPLHRLCSYIAHHLAANADEKSASGVGAAGDGPHVRPCSMLEPLAFENVPGHKEP